MLQQIGNLLSLVFVVLAGVFFLMGIYEEYRSYGQLSTGNKTVGRYFFFGALSLSLALFVFLTVENGFAWDNLGFAIILTIILTVVLRINVSIRRRTAIFLSKGKVSSLTSAIRGAIIELINVLTNKPPYDHNSDSGNENKK